MKRFAVFLILLVLWLVPTEAVRAQQAFYSAGIAIFGTSNSVVLQTNTYTIPLKQVNIAFTGATNVGTTVEGNFLFSFDKTNMFTGVVSTNAVGTNVTSTNFNAQTVTFSVYTYGQLKTGTNGLSVNPLYGP